MATQIICDFKENDKAHPCGTPAVWRIQISVYEPATTASANSTYNVLGIDSCGQHIAPLTAGQVAAATKPDLGARAAAELGNAPSALGRAVTKLDPEKAKLSAIPSSRSGRANLRTSTCDKGPVIVTGPFVVEREPMTDIEQPTKKEFPCDKCEQVYMAPQALGIHRRTAHGIVGKSHHTKAKAHRKTGSQQEPCPVCGINYQAKYLNYSHLPKMHGIYPNEQVVDAKALVHVPTNHKVPEPDWQVADDMVVLRRPDGTRWIAERFH